MQQGVQQNVQQGGVQDEFGEALNQHQYLSNQEVQQMEEAQMDEALLSLTLN